MHKLVLWSSCVVSKTLENVSDRKFLRKLWIPGQEIKQNFEHGYPYFCLILVVLLVWLPWLVGCKCLWAFHRFEEWLWLSWQCPWCHAHVRLWKQTHQHLDMILAPLGSFWRRNASRPKICHELVPQLVCSTSGKICTKPVHLRMQTMVSSKISHRPIHRISGWSLVTRSEKPCCSLGRGDNAKLVVCKSRFLLMLRCNLLWGGLGWGAKTVLQAFAISCLL